MRNHVFPNVHNLTFRYYLHRMSHLGPDYFLCHYWSTDRRCGAYNGRSALFTADELYSHTNNIFGHVVSDCLLIKSRCRTFTDSSVLCPFHRYLLCEGYILNTYPICYRCHSILDLMQVGVQAAFFIGDAPIRKYMSIEISSYPWCFSWLYMWKT